MMLTNTSDVIGCTSQSTRLFLGYLYNHSASTLFAKISIPIRAENDLQAHETENTILI